MSASRRDARLTTDESSAERRLAVPTLLGLSVRYLRQRPGRVGMTALGVALGVAVLFGALGSIASVDRGFARVVDGLVGRAEVVAVPVGGLDATISPEEVRAFAQSPGVEAATGVISASTAVGGPDGRVESELGARDTQTPRLLGMDVEEASRFYDFRLLEGRLFDAGADEAVLSESIASELGAGPGEEISVSLPTGPAKLRVVGVLANAGAGLYNEGRAVFVSRATGQDLAGTGDRVSLVVMSVQGDVQAWLRQHGDAASEGIRLMDAGSVAGPVRATADTFGRTLGALGTIVLFVAGFLIYLTLSMAVAERRQTFGVLRAIGATRSVVRRLVATEALALGAVGTILGLILGAGLVWLITSLLEQGSDPLPTVGLVLTPLSIGPALVLGVGATLVAAVVPARRAARVEPIEAIRDPRTSAPPAVASVLLGLLVFTAGVPLVIVRSAAGWRMALGIVLVLTGTVLVLPALIALVSRAAGRLAVVLRLGIARTVPPHLGRERARAAYTLGLVLAGMAMAIAMGATSASFIRTADRQLGRQFGADVQLTAASSFDKSFVAAVGDIADIEAVTPKWWGWSEIGDDDSVVTRVLAVDADRYFPRGGLAWRHGSNTATEAAFQDGGAVAVPESVASDRNLSVGDDVVLATTDGPLQFRVSGVYVSVGSSKAADAFSAIVTGIEDGRRWFGMGDPIDLDIWVASDADSAAVRDRIVQELGDRTTFVARTASEVEELTQERLGQLTTSLVVIVAVTMAVAGLGLANTLAVTVLERRREIGVLRAVGARRAQVARLAILEASVLVLIATVLAFPLGRFLAKPVVNATGDSFGTVLEFEFPWSWLVVIALLALAVGAIAAVAPARRSAHLDVIAALRYE